MTGDILEDEGQKMEAEINETGGEAQFIRLDVTSEAAGNPVLKLYVV